MGMVNANTDVFKTLQRTGTLTQSEMPVFGELERLFLKLYQVVLLYEKVMLQEFPDLK